MKCTRKLISTFSKALTQCAIQSFCASVCMLSPCRLKKLMGAKARVLESLSYNDIDILLKIKGLRQILHFWLSCGIYCY